MKKPKIHPCTQYALDVVEGRRVVGHSEWLACERHLDDLKRQGTKDFPWVFDEEKANKIYEFFSYLRHVKGPRELVGTQIILAPFEMFDLGSIFGWVHMKNGLRRFTKANIQEARKNAKSTEAAGVALYLMVGDGEESPEVYCAAVDKEQARIVYKIAKRMAEKSPDIKKRLVIRNYQMSHVTRGGEMMPFSKDTENKDGFNPSGSIIDEYHAHKTSEIHDLLESAQGQRSQSLMLIISTAGMNAENNPCYLEYKLGKQILERKIINERYFIMIRELDPDDDEHDPNVWIKANPLRAATKEGLEKLKEQHDNAFNSKIASKIRTFRIKNLDKWIYDSELSYMGEYMAKWDGLAVCDLQNKETTPERLRSEFEKLTTGLPCNFGIDLSKSIDLTADGFVFVLPDGRIAVTAHGFIPEAAVVRHERTDRIPYRDWANDGWVTITDGEVTDFHRIKDHMKDKETGPRWIICEVDFDPYNATHLATELMDEGYTCVQVRQGVQTLSEPTKKFREKVANSEIVHDGNPLLKWCMENAKEKVDSNENIKLTKETASDTQRIDLLAAIIDAMSGLPRLEEHKGRDISEEILSEDWGM